MEDDAGDIVLSRKKAHRIRGWEMIITEYKEGDVVNGRVTRKIKGGLLVDIGVHVFLPAARSTSAGRATSPSTSARIECMILKIDESAATSSSAAAS